MATEPLTPRENAVRQDAVRAHERLRAIAGILQTHGFRSSVTAVPSDWYELTVWTPRAGRQDAEIHVDSDGYVEARQWDGIDTETDVAAVADKIMRVLNAITAR